MEFGSLAEWAMAFITGVSAYFIWLQLRASNEQLRESHTALVDDHERSRRELSVRLLQDWTKGLQFGTSTIMRLLRQLSQEQCNAIVRMEPIYLDNSGNLHNLAKRIIDLKWPNFDAATCLCADGKFRIDDDYLEHFPIRLRYTQLRRNNFGNRLA